MLTFSVLKETLIGTKLENLGKIPKTEPRPEDRRSHRPLSPRGTGFNLTTQVGYVIPTLARLSEPRKQL